MLQFTPTRIALIFLLLSGGIFLFSGLGYAPLIDWDENIYAEASRQMVLRGEYLNVYVNDYPFAEKPPLFFWLQSVSYHIFGINEFGARFPSALFGIATMLLFFFVGKSIRSVSFGIVWALVYLSSFLPANLARAAVIDHTFNFWIAVAIFSLYFYDVHRQSYLLSADSRPFYRQKYWQFLTVASLSMGLAVLTKGPVGGVIPLVGFGVYKWFYRTPMIFWKHFIYCGVLSLTIATSWYLLNWIMYGSEFLLGFIEFQRHLFTRTLEGHVGPFYYHFVVAIFGLFPWTPFFFGIRKSHLELERPHHRALTLVCLGWLIFVLVLFSFVKTKLPHYSASIYIPLSFLVAIFIDHHREQSKSFPKWILVGVFFLGVGLSIFFQILPELGTQYLKQNEGIDISFRWSSGLYITAIGMLVMLMIACYLWWKQKVLIGVYCAVIAMIFCTQGIWRFQIPTAQQYIQEPLLTIVKEVQDRGDKLVFYRFISFAALFYGNDSIEMLHTYKFPNDPNILNSIPTDQTLIVVTERKNESQVQKDHPLLVFAKRMGPFSVYELRATSAK